MTHPNGRDVAVEPTPCAERNCRVAGAVLVDRRGWLLLQERDEHAPVDPNVWGLVGGHVEDGETWEEGLARELKEETGLDAADLELEIWFDEVVQFGPKVSSHLADAFRLWVGYAELTDADITVGEGRQIVFVDPGRIRDGSLALGGAPAYLLPKLLDSELYARLAG